MITRAFWGGVFIGFMGGLLVGIFLAQQTA